MIQWPCLAARPNILIITFILTPSSQANGVSMSASSRRSRYNLLRALYHNASMAKWFNKRFIAAKLNNMILRLLYHNAGVTAVTLLTFSTYKSSQNLYFIEKNSLQNRRSRICFQLGIKIFLSPEAIFMPLATPTVSRVLQKKRRVILISWKQSCEPSFCLFFERNNSFAVIYYNTTCLIC